MVACLIAIVSSPRAAAIDTGQTRIFKYLMGTSMRVEVYGGDPAMRKEAADEAFAAIAEVDRLMSDYRADSEVSLLNREAAAHAVQVSQAVMAVIEIGKRLSVQSGGAFSLVAGAGAGRDADIALNPDTRTVRFMQPRLTVSLGGGAKGFASELAAASLHRRGLSGAVDTSGTQYLTGLPPGKRVWSVGIGDPLRRDAVLGAIDVAAGGVSTVSAASHRIDPRTGQPATASLSATVVSADGTLSDALAKAAFVLGPGDGLALLATFPHTWGVIAYGQPDGRIACAVSPGHESAFHPSKR